MSFGIRCRVVIGVGTILLAALAGCDRSATEWESAKVARSVDAVKAFIEKHPQGKQIDEARALLATVQREETQWTEASKDGTLRALHNYVSEFPDSRFRGRATEASSKALDGFKPDNVMIIIKAPDGSGTMLGVWHGQVTFSLSGAFIPTFIPPDPAQKNLAVAVLDGTGLIPQLKPGHAYIWLGGVNFIEWREFPATHTQPMVAAQFGMPEGGSRIIVVPDEWLQADASKPGP
jgi:hypothetical protein